MYVGFQVACKIPNEEGKCSNTAEEGREYVVAVVVPDILPYLIAEGIAGNYQRRFAMCLMSE